MELNDDYKTIIDYKQNINDDIKEIIEFVVDDNYFKNELKNNYILKDISDEIYDNIIK